MHGFVADIEKLTKENTDFRRILYTSEHLQLVLMSIPPGGEIGDEVHKEHDQFFRIEHGAGEVWIDGQRHSLSEDDCIVVPAGARHNIINLGRSPLQLYSLYSGPEH